MTESKSARIVPHSGVAMPAIIYGTAWKKKRTGALVAKALITGFRGIDTACQPKHYHEPGVGKGLKAAFGAGVKRQDLYIQTKFTPLAGQDPKRVPYDPEAPLPTQVAQSFEVSLKNLGVDTLDGLVLHSPLKDPTDLRAVWRAMEGLVTSGGVRQIGISNCYDPRLLTALYNEARVKPAVVQNRFYKQTGYDQAIRQFCKDKGIVYQSFWTLTANPHILSHAIVKAIAKRDGLTTAQVLFRYLSGNGILPLTGTSSSQHMQQDLEAVATPLRKEDQEAIRPIII